ncbi:hypothetical protein chiPu_0020587 [Chiloscyllium punctatum]|uniref:Sphingomyelin phosphodiesterase C-terminal domain-containing protein n=1 Tax=Chiloscyllium punctatum TaxID=137246 RepID=A0A401RH58_CHIPU|nr:hypothetical protein [Chiloscyllium punctatum]
MSHSSYSKSSQTPRFMRQWGTMIFIQRASFLRMAMCSTIKLQSCGPSGWKQHQSPLSRKVYIIGHVPPGFFEKKRGTHWFQEKFNKRYIEIIQKHSQVIAGQFFGHQHRDSFKIFYSNDGSPVSAMFIAPAVTPWKTTLPGLQKGSQNPGIRLFQYDVDTLQILDMVTYYLNLTLANAQALLWEEEYRLTEAFQVHDGTAGSMQAVLDKLSQDKDYLQKYYEYNSVSYDLGDCDDWCRTDHICAIRNVDYARIKAFFLQRTTIPVGIFFEEHSQMLKVVDSTPPKSNE